MDTTSKLDAAIAAATSRKEKKDGKSSTRTPKPARPASKRPRLTDEEKSARAAGLAATRAEAKSARDLARAEKRAAKAANKTPAHMAKVLKAAGRLPKLSASAAEVFETIAANLSLYDLDVLARHVEHRVRSRRTERALLSTEKLKVGSTVRIVGGDPRFFGTMATIEKCQRIRAYVRIPGRERLVYLFVSELEPVSGEQAEGLSAGEPAQASA